MAARSPHLRDFPTFNKEAVHVRARNANRHDLGMHPDSHLDDPVLVGSRVRDPETGNVLPSDPTRSPLADCHSATAGIVCQYAACSGLAVVAHYASAEQ